MRPVRTIETSGGASASSRQFGTGLSGGGLQRQTQRLQTRQLQTQQLQTRPLQKHRHHSTKLVWGACGTVGPRLSRTCLPKMASKRSRSGDTARLESEWGQTESEWGHCSEWGKRSRSGATAEQTTTLAHDGASVPSRRTEMATRAMTSRAAVAFTGIVPQTVKTMGTRVVFRGTSWRTKPPNRGYVRLNGRKNPHNHKPQIRFGAQIFPLPAPFCRFPTASRPPPSKDILTSFPTVRGLSRPLPDRILTTDPCTEGWTADRTIGMFLEHGW